VKIGVFPFPKCPEPPDRGVDFPKKLKIMTVRDTEKSERCYGPTFCCMRFQAIRTTGTAPTEEENNTGEEKVEEAILYCEKCGHVEALEFTD